MLKQDVLLGKIKQCVLFNMSEKLKTPVIILFLGAMTCSSSIIMIKGSKIDPVLLAGYRLFLAGVFLSPLYFRDLKKERKQVKDTLFACWPGVVLGVHFITWVIGCRITYAANATLIVNMVPAVMPFLLYFMIKEVINKREMIGSAFAVSGIFLLMITDFKLNAEHFRGDVMCFLSMLTFALYLVMSRKYRDSGSIWLYTVPLFTTGGLVCFLIGACRGVFPWHGLNAVEIGYILAIAIIPTIIGHSALNYAMKKIRGQIVGVLNLSQFVFAAIYGYMFFGEIPDQVFYISVFFLVIGICIIVTKKREVPQAEVCPES